MEFEYNPEKLIEEVKKRPALWDTDSPEYRSVKIRKQLWREIVFALNQSSKEASKEQLIELEKHLQKKWRGMKDSLVKYAKNPTKFRVPYVYFKQMQFVVPKLITSTSNTSSATNTTFTEYEVDKKAKKHSKKKLKTKAANEQEQEEQPWDEDDHDNWDESYHDNGYGNNQQQPVTPVTKRKRKQSISHREQFAFANVGPAPTVYEDSDPDKLFLLSLMPHLKSVPSENLLNVKMELMQVLNNANMY